MKFDGRNSRTKTAVMLCMISNSAKATRERETKSVFTRTTLSHVVADNSWAPDTANVRSKMIYASSKESIKRAFNGIGVEIQGTHKAEVSYDSVLDKVS